MKLHLAGNLLSQDPSEIHCTLPLLPNKKTTKPHDFGCDRHGRTSSQRNFAGVTPRDRT
jgi:hypothetical protein